MPRQAKVTNEPKSKLSSLARKPLIFVPILIVAVAIAYICARQYLMQREAEMFHRSERLLLSLQQLSVNDLNATEASTSNYCQEGHGKFDTPGLYCFIGVSFTIKASDTNASISASLNAQGKASAAGFSTKSKLATIQTNEGWRGDRSIGAGTEKMSCVETHNYTASSGQLLVQVTCNAQAMRPHFTLRQ